MFHKYLSSAYVFYFSLVEQLIKLAFLRQEQHFSDCSGAAYSGAVKILSAPEHVPIVRCFGAVKIICAAEHNCSGAVPMCSCALEIRLMRGACM